MEAAYIRKNDFNEENVQKYVQVRLQVNAKSGPYQFINVQVQSFIGFNWFIKMSVIGYYQVCSNNTPICRNWNLQDLNIDVFEYLSVECTQYIAFNENLIFKSLSVYKYLCPTMSKFLIVPALAESSMGKLLQKLQLDV